MLICSVFLMRVKNMNIAVIMWWLDLRMLDPSAFLFLFSLFEADNKARL